MSNRYLQREDPNWAPYMDRVMQRMSSLISNGKMLQTRGALVATLLGVSNVWKGSVASNDVLTAWTVSRKNE